MAGNIVHLIGYPGTGKLTIAKEIVSRRSDYVLVDNHLINNPVFSLVNADGKSKLTQEVWAQVAAIRNIVLDTIERLSPPHLTFVMTNFATNDAEDTAVCRRTEDIAFKRGGKYMPVILTCDADEHRRRIVADERRLNFKSTDASSVDRLRQTVPLIALNSHENFFSIDVTKISPAVAANLILDKLESGQRMNQMPPALTL